MAIVSPMTGLGHFCDSIGLSFSFPAEKGCKPIGLLVKQGVNEGFVRYSNVSGLTCEHWASDVMRRIVFWNFKDGTTRASTEGGYELRKYFEEVMRKRPSDCLLEPGSAFLIHEPEVTGEDGVVVPRLPQRAADGSYAYEVCISKLSDREFWKRAVINAGYSVCLSADTTRYHGSRFQGGDHGLSPPLRLVSWISTEKVAPVSVGVAGLSLGMRPLSFPEEKGHRDWTKMPEFESCKSIVKIFRAGDKEGVIEALQHPPSEMLEQARLAPAHEVASVEKEITDFVATWRPDKGKPFPTLPIVIRKMRSTASKEQNYCALFCKFHEMFIVDLATEVIRLRSG